MRPWKSVQLCMWSKSTIPFAVIFDVCFFWHHRRRVFLLDSSPAAEFSVTLYFLVLEFRFVCVCVCVYSFFCENIFSNYFKNTCSSCSEIASIRCGMVEHKNGNNKQKNKTHTKFLRSLRQTNQNALTTRINFIYARHSLSLGVCTTFNCVFTGVWHLLVFHFFASQIRNRCLVHTLSRINLPRPNRIPLIYFPCDISSCAHCQRERRHRKKQSNTAQKNNNNNNNGRDEDGGEKNSQQPKAGYIGKPLNLQIGVNIVCTLCQYREMENKANNLDYWKSNKSIWFQQITPFQLTN